MKLNINYNQSMHVSPVPESPSVMASVCLQAGQAAEPKDTPEKYGPRWFCTELSRRELPSEQCCRKQGDARVKPGQRTRTREQTHLVLLSWALDHGRVACARVDRGDMRLPGRVLIREELRGNPGNRVVLVCDMRKVRKLRIRERERTSNLTR